MGNTPTRESLNKILGGDYTTPYTEQVKPGGERINIDPETLKFLQNFANNQTANILRLQKVDKTPDVLAALQEPITQIATAIGAGARKIDKKPFTDVLLTIPEIPKDKVENFAEMIIERMQEAHKQRNRDSQIKK